MFADDKKTGLHPTCTFTTMSVFKSADVVGQSSTSSIQLRRDFSAVDGLSRRVPDRSRVWELSLPIPRHEPPMNGPGRKPTAPPIVCAIILAHLPRYVDIKFAYLPTCVESRHARRGAGYHSDLSRGRPSITVKAPLDGSCLLTSSMWDSGKHCNTIGKH